MSRTLSSVVLLAMLGSAGLTDAQMSTAPPPANLSATEPTTKQSPDVTSPFKARGTATTNSSRSDCATSPSMSAPLPNSGPPGAGRDGPCR
jgi:hypothetical protein